MSASLRDPLAEPAQASNSKSSAGLSLGLPRSKGGRSTLSPFPSAPPPSGLELRRLDEDDSIRATDSDALGCRLSALKAGYFEGIEQDPYSELFSTSSSSAISQGQSFLNPPVSRRPPIINVGTFLRCTALDKVVSDFLLSGDASQKKQIVSVGAGSDARYWRLQSNPALASRLSHYLELDFPSIVSKKLQAISKHSALQSHLDAEPSLRSGPLGDSLICSRYAIQSCDLRGLAGQKLSTSGTSDDGDVLQSLDPTKPTLILAECVLAYMAPEASVSLIETIASRIHPSTEVRALCYEMCIAGDTAASASTNGHQQQSANSFGKVMLSNLETRGLSLLGARAFPTTDSHAQRFQQALTSSATTSSGSVLVQSGATSLRAIWSTLPPAERERLGRVEGLDEVEELELLLSCYCISWGSRIGSQLSSEGSSAQGSAGVGATSIGGDPQTQDQAGAIDDVAPVVESSRPRPDAHTQRYDRQLRLWASSGQASLESANVLLVGASHLGAQVLKNLILPGIGSFTVLDAQKVGAFDLGNNFFLETHSSGKSRAEEVAKCLAELNPSVKSRAKVADAQDLLDNDPAYFGDYSLIIAADQPPDVVSQLADLAWHARESIGIPFMTVAGAGMVGEVRVQIKEMGVIETHPASTIDLRLTEPWTELSDYAKSYNIDDTDSMAHSHVPFIVILLRALADWQASHSNEHPSPSKDRKDFVTSINSLRQAGNLDLENFDEAIAALGQNVWRPISSGRKVSTEIEALFKDPACDMLHSKTTNFWLLVRALRDFVASPSTSAIPGGDGYLPLPGSLPDFKSTSSTYVEVQKIYKQKALRDLAALKQHLAAVLKEAGLPSSAIGEEEIESFAKHAGYLKLVRGKSLRASAERPAKDLLAMAFMDPVNPPTIQHHLAFLAADRFYRRHQRFPGSSKAFSDSITGSRASSSLQSSNGSTSASTSRNATPRADGQPEKKRQRSGSPYTSFQTCSIADGNDRDGDSQMDDPSTSLVESESDLLVKEATFTSIEQDESQALEILISILEEWGVEDEDQLETCEDAVKEMVRSGHADVASTASLLGGVAAQEAIKLITKQYIPLEGTAIYDGIKQAIGTFNL